MSDKKTPKQYVAISSSDTKSDDEILKWTEDIYSSLNEDDLKQLYDIHRYQGFNRIEVLKDLRSKVNDHKLVAEIILVCALKGPQRAASTVLSNNLTPQKLGIPATYTKGSKGASCGRITAATADFAAFMLKKINFPKRINIDCPAWLQFPAAGSILMNDALRKQHKEFSIRFSELIGGVFNEQIYDQMAMNAYKSDKLNLF